MRVVQLEPLVARLERTFGGVLTVDRSDFGFSRFMHPVGVVAAVGNRGRADDLPAVGVFGRYLRTPVL